jgi:ubiquinone/menaquinone biosynthesis C-methylase UbiE
MDLLYDLFMAPLEAIKLKRLRKTLLVDVRGTVLEIGTGTGANLPYLPYHKINHLYLTDIQLSKGVKSYEFPKHLKVNLLECPLEELEIPESSLDSIVFTLVFCTVENASAGLQKVFRLLKPGGKIYFIEHVLPHHHRLRTLAHKLNPIWSKAASGCNLNRETLNTILKAGFTIERHSVSLGGALIEGVALVAKK